MLEIDEKKIAERIVKDFIGVKEDEIVMVRCGEHNLSLAEECALECRKAGAFPMINVTSDRYVKRIYEEVEDRFLEKPQNRFAEISRLIDTLIIIETMKDPENLRNIPEYKRSLTSQARMPVRKAETEKGVRIVVVMYPTPEMARAYNVSYEEYHDRVWKATLYPPDDLYHIGKPLKNILKGKDRIRLTSEKGTDLSFSIKDRPILIDNGEFLEENREEFADDNLLNIPAGEVFTSIVEDSTEGRIVFDRVFLDGVPVTDLMIRFENGRAVEFSAKENEDKFAEFFETFSPEDKIAGEFGIGINPEVKNVIGCLATDEKIAGTIHLALGANDFYGGRNDTKYHFDMIMDKPTATADDEIFLKNGNFIGTDI